jgi:nicotinamide-nucleotide amidase
MSRRVEELIDGILEYATAHGLTVCTAESCSAGRLAIAFAKGEGAADAFLGGVIAYTKEAKTRLLGVPSVLLRERTAVCGAVAEAMALGAVQKSGAAVGVSITGVAGPGADEDGHPVGLVYCGVARRDGSVRHHRLDLASRNPEDNIEAACVAALSLLKSFCFS